MTKTTTKTHTKTNTRTKTELSRQEKSLPVYINLVILRSNRYIYIYRQIGIWHPKLLMVLLLLSCPFC